MSKRPSKLPIILVTGASGIVGKHFLEAAKNDFYIYAMARRSRKDVGLQYHPNVNWIRVDVSVRESVERVMNEIADAGGVDFVLHLAGYYDFGNKDNSEYKKTNVNGTRYVLENVSKLNIKRFIFASSLTVTEYRRSETVLNEDSPADANFPYAVSKRECEHLLEKYADQFPIAVLRFAAIFSDWCEYGPLYILLTTWLSDHWDSKILAGKGKAAIPYLHVKNLNHFILTIFNKSEKLPKFVRLIASHDGCTPQRDLFKIAMRYNYGKMIKPFYMPKWLSFLGVLSLDLIGRLRRKRPFIRPWMISYVDTEMNVDASRTRKLLGWAPISRYHINRRILFIIENMKSNPYAWERINTEAIYKRITDQPGVKIYEKMIVMEEQIVNEIVAYLLDEANVENFVNYNALSEEELHKRINYIYHILKTAVRTGDRMHILNYAHNLAIERFVENFEAQEVIKAVEFIGGHIVNSLKKQGANKDMEQRIYDEVMMTIQLIVDELEETFEQLSGHA